MKRIVYPLFLFLSYICYGQIEYNISGTIFSPDNIIIEKGEVIVLDKDLNIIESSWVKNGKFYIEKLKPNEYTINVTSLGYSRKSIKILLDQDKIITITLHKKTELLDEVTIKTIKNPVTIHNGNLKISVKNSNLESSTSAIDLLSKLPGIQISPNKESIYTIGKGNPLLYIDNQKIDLDQLKSLSVEDIKDIELIENPPAKYEADGRILILITRESSKMNGHTITLSEITSFKNRFNNYLGVNSSYKKNKLELRANFNYNQLGFWESARSELKILDKNIESKYDVNAIGPRPQFIIGGGLFYQLSKKDYISVYTNLRAQSDKFPIQTNTVLQKEKEKDYILSKGENDEKRSFISSTVNFNKKIDSATNLFFGFQHSNYIRHPKSTIFNNLNETGFKLSQNRNQRYEIDVFASKIDIEKEIHDTIKFEMGGAISKANAVALSNFEFVNPSNIKTSKYDYQESIYASYAQFSGKLNKIEYSAGIRSEMNIVKGGFKEAKLLVDRKQFNYFPKLQIKFPLDTAKSIYFNYNKTINRPGYLNASSISTFINPFVEFSRNVNLKPTITEEISAKLQYKKYNFNLNYYNKDNPVFYDVSYNSIDNRVISSPQNFKKESGYQIQFTNTATYKFWNTTNSLALEYNRIENPTTISKSSKPYLYYFSNNEFRIAPKTILGLNLWGLTRRNQGAFKRNALFMASISFSKTFLEKLQLAINFNDIFKSVKYQNNYTSNNIKVQDIFYADSQEISFSLKYKFGETKKSSFKNMDIDNSSNRMQ